MKKVTLVVSLLFMLVYNKVEAQHYKWQVDVQSVDSMGFYKIDLNPKVISKLNPYFADIRIKDENGEEVPYFLEKEAYSIEKREFKEYELLKKVRWRNGATVIIIENSNLDTINNIQLQIKNFDIRKHLELSASDDYINWYTIKENYNFYSANGYRRTSEMKGLYFPYTDYRYYRIIIHDVFSLPINVLKVGYYDNYREVGKFKKLDRPLLMRFDSLKTKQTYVKINTNGVPYFDKMVLSVDKPEFFYRSASICVKHTDKKGKDSYIPLKRLILNSNSDLTFYHSDFQYEEFYIVIDNHDNPPLKNIGVELFQLNRYMVAHLEPSRKYKLVFENERVKRRPIYDIQYFKNVISSEVPTIYCSNIRPISYRNKKKVEISTLWMWGAIGLVALFLAYVSFKMINEMGRHEVE